MPSRRQPNGLRPAASRDSSLAQVGARIPEGVSAAQPRSQARPPGPEREDAPAARLAVEREARAVEQVSAPEPHRELPRSNLPAPGNGSELTVVPVAAPSVNTPGDAFDSVSFSVSVSSPSSCEASSTATSTVFSYSPAWNDTVPLAAV